MSKDDIVSEPSEQVVEYFKVLIAGKKIEIECKYRNLFYVCKDYLCKFESPDLVIPLVTQKELEQERVAALSTDLAEGRGINYYSNVVLEMTYVYRKLADMLLDYGFLMIHGAAIATEGKCFIFMAKSGTGKTTHVLKWLKQHPDSFIVNGDKPLIDVSNLLVFGTPWCGKEGLSTNESVALGGLIFLERGKENIIERIPFKEMIVHLLKQCHIPKTSDSTIKIMRLINRMQNIPCWKLWCNMEDSAGEVSYDALVRNFIPEDDL